MQKLVLLIAMLCLALGCDKAKDSEFDVASVKAMAAEIEGGVRDNDDEGESEPTSTPLEPPAENPQGMVYIPPGRFLMGGDAKEQGGNSHSHQTSYPIHEVELKGFWIDETEVTNRQFNQFVQATNYVTLAEKPLPQEQIDQLKKAAETNLKQLKEELQNCRDEDRKEIEAIIKRIEEASKLSQATAGAIIFATPKGELYNDTDINQWWRLEPTANWRQPGGPGTTWEDRLDHPVVNITFADAKAYAAWAGKRLPTEAEWERAARGGLKRKPFAWGSELFPDGDKKWMANIFQGTWPHENSLEDGFLTTAPVKSFSPNPYGLYDVAGNVWEMVSDYYHPRAFDMPSSRDRNPKGPLLSDVSVPGQKIMQRVMKGGSFLCSDVWCKGYQPGARQPFEDDSPTNHTGFRCVKDVPDQ